MNLRKEVSNALVSRGFRRNGRMHMLRVDGDFSFWVDTGPLGQRVDIAPFVGIRHDRVEQLKAELMHLPQDDWVGTVGANVGYALGQQYKWWEAPAQCDEVMNTIELALEGLRPFLSLSKLPEAWAIQGARTPGWRYRDIVVSVLTGDSAGVLSRLESAREAFCQQEGEICEQFRLFARNLSQSHLPSIAG